MVLEWDGLLWSRKRELGNTFRFCYSGVSGSGASAACIVCSSKKKVLTDKDKDHWTGKPAEPNIEC